MVYGGNNATFSWWCFEGGSRVLIEKMLTSLVTPPFYNHRVTAITENSETPDPLMRLKVSVLGLPDEHFSHVVSTVPFAALRTINTDGVSTNFGQREAMRVLDYGDALKVGIKFRTRWWEKDAVKYKQLGGASYTDRQSRTVVYPSYGIGEEGPGVLMVSYNWCMPISSLHIV